MSEHAPHSSPRLSFLMLTYNLEAIIRASVESAFKQDYDNLEIVICDDCSTDRTFHILQELVRNYHGPHHIILHQNKVNQGITANFFQAYDLASGQWLCMASGDDIFLPNRATKLMEAARLHPNAGIIASQVDVIDGQGKRYTPPKPPVFWIGASLCWHRDILGKFPRPFLKRPPEDSTLIPRAFFLGKTYVQIPEVTMHYRMDGHHYTRLSGNNSREIQRRLMRVMAENMASTISHRRDYEYACKQGWIKTDHRVIEHMNQCIGNTQRRLDQARQRMNVLNENVTAKINFILKGQPGLPDSFLRRLWLVMGNNLWLNEAKCALQRLVPQPNRQGTNTEPLRILSLEDYVKGTFISF